MSRPSLRCIASVALCLVLAVSLPLAGKTQSETSRPPAQVSQAGRPTGFLPTLWKLLIGTWTKGGSPAADSGCSLDPFGLCSGSQGTTDAETDNGCGLDPYGHCLPGH